MTYGVIIANKYPDIIKPLIDSINEMIPNPKPKIIIIGDNHTNGYGFDAVLYKNQHFVFASAINTGIKALGTLDVLTINDDCRIIEPDTFSRLAKIAEINPKIGILSPLIKGCVGNPLQLWYGRQNYWGDNGNKLCLSKVPLCFPCVWIRRKTLDEIGLLDERFTSYGGEDNELCNRARKFGWLTAVTNQVVVQHGDGGNEMSEGRGKTWSLSYARRDKAEKEALKRDVSSFSGMRVR